MLVMATTPLPEVTIYSKPDCCLCEEAKEQLLALNKQLPFLLKEVDISRDEELLQKFGEEVPVIFIEGRKAFKFRIDPGQFKEKLARTRIKRDERQRAESALSFGMEVKK